jgi:hypothetical protein
MRYNRLVGRDWPDATNDRGNRVKRTNTTTNAGKFTVTYEGRVPKTLRDWIEKHAADKVYDVDHGGGFCTDSGMAYDVGIRNGWRVTYPDRMHTVIEPTVRDVIASLRTLEPCDCEQCRIGLAIDARKTNSGGDR